MLWCLTDYGLCDKHYEGFQDVPRAVVWSKDAGVTWSVAGEAPLGAAPVGFYQGEVVLASSTTGDTPATYTLLPSGNPWLPADPRRVPAVPDEVTVGGVTYSLSYEDETFVDDNLSYPGATLIASENAAEPMLAFPGGQVRSVHELPDGRLIGVAERSAKAYLLEDPDRVLPAVGRDLVLIDLVRREVRPVAAPAAANESSYIVLVSVVGGPFARVDTPGSCLNVRPQPSTAGESLGCFADGVMLYDLDETADAGGITWLRVETPDRREGWASLEFIERLR